jgi:hypothetical protein
MNSDWRLLEQLLGPERCRDIMFMGCSGELYLYKHINTRRYLNIAPDGSCFQYTTAGYIPIDREEAIKRVFG